jgi:hypothetical protein
MQTTLSSGPLPLLKLVKWLPLCGKFQQSLINFLLQKYYGEMSFCPLLLHQNSETAMNIAAACRPVFTSLVRVREWLGHNEADHIISDIAA